MITRKTLNEVASALSVAQKAEDLGREDIVRDLTIELANIFSRYNPRLDRKRFYHAASQNTEV